MANQTVKVVFEGKDQTSKAINSLKGNLNNATKAIDRIKGSLGGMTGALGAAAGVAGFGLLAKSALQTADSLGKTATKLGVTSNQLFKFQTQAELAGISTQTADMALQRFTRRTAEAAVGTGEAQGALKELRLDAAKLQALPLDQRMKVLADAFQEVKSPADRLRLAFKLFDSEGAAMVNMLEGGSESLEETERRMKKLGITIDRKATPEIEDFNDTVFLLGRRVQASMINGLGKSVPVMERVADRLAEMAVPLTGDLLDGLDWLLKNLDKITRAFKVLIAAMVVAKVISFAAAVISLVKALGGMAAVLAVLASPVALFIAAAVAAAAAIFAFREEIGDTIDSLDDYLGITDKVGKAVKFFKGILGDAEDQVDDNTDATKKVTKETDDFEEAVDNLNDTVDNTEPVLEEFGDTVDYVATEEINATVRTDAFREALEDLREAARTGADDISDFESEMAEFKNTVENTEATTEDFNNALLNSIEELTGVTFEARRVREEIDKVKASIEALNNAEGDLTNDLAVLNRRLEELGEELVEATKAADGLTASQREVLDEVNKTETEIKKLNDKLDDLDSLYKKGAISARQYQIATENVHSEIKELNSADLTQFEQAVRDAFDGTPLEEFLSELDGITGSAGSLDALVVTLIGEGGVKTAISNCFGVSPVTDFGQAIKDLFTGNGSALGGFGAALGTLTSAFSGFFSSSLTSFGNFKDAIVRVLQDIASAAIASVGINFLKNLIPGLRDGGSVDGFAYGGMVSGPGGPRADAVPAMLSSGEFVMQAKAVDKFGLGFMSQLNDGMMPGFADGGGVGMKVGRVTGTIGGFPSFEAFMKWLRGLGYNIPRFLEYDPGGITLNPFGRVMENLEMLIIAAVKAATSMAANRMGGTPRDYDGMFIPEIAGGIISKILGPIASAGNFDKAQELNNGFDYDGLVSSLFNSLLNPMQDFKLGIGDFSFDKQVKELFNNANAVAGGSLFVQGRQFGGPLERGQASMVGEDGPELFVPSRGGTVSPIKGNSVDLQQSIDDMKDEIVMLRRQLSRELSGRRPAGVR